MNHVSSIACLLYYNFTHVLYTPYFSRIGTSRHFREWLNSRSRRRVIMDGGQRNQYHSLICMCTMYCTILVLRMYTSRILASGSEVNLFLRVVEFANSTRLAKFAKIKPSRNIWRIQYSNSRYPRYAIWPRGGACHANHACAALTVSRSCQLAFVFFHWKCTQVLQKSLSLSIKQACFKRYHHDLLRHLVVFSKFEWFISADHKIKNFSTHFVHKL